MVVQPEIFLHHCADLLVLDSRMVLHELAHRAVVHMIAETQFGLYLVAVGHGHIVHLVAETQNQHVLGVSPCRTDAHPHRYLAQSLVILPMANHNLAAQAHAAAYMSELAVTVGRLVQIHEIHVHGVPRNLAVILRVKMKQRLPELLESVYPHLSGREGVHPCDDSYAPGVVIRRLEYVLHLSGRIGRTLVHHLYRQLARFVEAVHHFCRMAVYGDHGVTSVKQLRAGHPPDLMIAECFHNDNQLIVIVHVISSVRNMRWARACGCSASPRAGGSWSYPDLSSERRTPSSRTAP